MRVFSKPNIIVSKCLGFANCRYNGAIISDDFADKLKPYVNFQPVCPEVEIGLGVPRDPVRIISMDGELKLFQPATEKDLTGKINDFCSSFLSSVEDVDGFMLKSRSPSCGVKDVKIYPGTDKGMAIDKGQGFFGKAVLDKLPYLTVEDEGRLTNFRIREHFLISIFNSAGFRQVKQQRSLRELAKFHTENKLMLMLYNQNEMRILGRIIANKDKKSLDSVVEEYEYHLFKAFSRIPKYVSSINVLMHGLGYFSKDLSHEEKAFFLDSLEKYRSKKIPLSVPANVLKSFIIRFKDEYLIQETFFEPYPEDLIEMTDSGKGRDL